MPVKYIPASIRTLWFAFSDFGRGVPITHPRRIFSDYGNGPQRAWLHEAQEKSMSGYLRKIRCGTK